MYKYILLFHILAATIWTGGHIVLATCILPDALKQEEPNKILEFEAKFETIAITALIIQLITGLWLIHNVLPSPSQWVSFSDGVSQLVGMKLILLSITIILALDSRWRLIPKLDKNNLLSLAYHIFAVTVLSIAFVVVGVGFRVGGFW